jgi:hypothetical protein
MIIMKTKAQKSELQNDDIFDYLSIVIANWNIK